MLGMMTGVLWVPDNHVCAHCAGSILIMRVGFVPAILECRGMLHTSGIGSDAYRTCRRG